MDSKKKKILIFISVKEVLIRRSELLDANLKVFLLVHVNREMRILILKKTFQIGFSMRFSVCNKFDLDILSKYYLQTCSGEHGPYLLKTVQIRGGVESNEFRINSYRIFRIKNGLSNQNWNFGSSKYVKVAIFKPENWS